MVRFSELLLADGVKISWDAYCRLEPELARPEVAALLLVPISPHALFSRALVTAPTSTIRIAIDPYTTFAFLSCDGRRSFDLAPGSSVTVRRGRLPVRVVRLQPQPFTDRLVAKFGLPVEGWRRNGFA